MKAKLHIGELIHKRVQELKLTNSQFAKLINCHRTNVNNIYKQETIDVAKLQKISEVLHVDFFKYYIADGAYSLLSDNEVISKRIEFSQEELEKLFKSIPVVVEVIVKT
ncbi:helix-turn-helix domain-containing protein [Odoribacter laneus]|uniref:helix-turn-helix domain-containing protein n=1 Tax=Odoribacter laneus TaxID=626933 RepID=UPI003AF76D95